MLRQLWVRMQLLVAVGRGLLIRSDKVQARILSDEVLTNIDRVEPYGYSYRPKSGCQTYLLFPSGDRSHGVAIVIGDRRYQMELAESEVAIHDHAGNHVHLQRGGVIEAKAATKVIADTPLFETTGHAKIAGDLEVAGDTLLKGDTLVEGSTTSNGGYYGVNGGAATMQGGLQVTGTFTVNDKNVSDTHTHTSNGQWVQTTGVD
uniref:Mu-like prophage protein gp45 n=1 Tax=Candidatus Kentrum sp. TUN TaxID=2126343 RepID=A0A451A6G6_9GAMM|nr:MAG: Mu-like prophage protein gp45 [Candidatus Kentron sp. TUN]